MDAIPSLCASTASCGVAATGFALGRPSSRGNETEGVNGASINPATPLAPRSSFSTPASRVRRTTALRPQSATVPKASPWSVLGKSSFEGPQSTESNIAQSRGLNHGNKVSDLSEEPEENTDRSSWRKRVSTIAQSRDGSVISSQRPSTPSLFSNGSSAPFLGSRPASTPRNRLVKRSTSHKVLHSGSYSGGPFSAGQTPTFRRPVTSHQRSEQLRLQTAQQSIQTAELPLDTFDENSSSHTTQNVPEKSQPQYTWKPFFRTKSVQVPSDSSRRTQSVSRVARISSLSSNSRPTDKFRCVEIPTGSSPTLLKATEVEKYPSSEQPYHHSILKSRPAAESSAPPAQEPQLRDRALTGPIPPSTQQPPRPRPSFSLTDIMPTTSPPWKSKSGSLRRKKGRDPINPSRRISSAPQTRLEDSEDIKDRAYESQGESGLSNSRKVQRKSSSPLPLMTRLSAFDIDIPAEFSSDPPSPATHQLPTSSTQTRPHTASYGTSSSSRRRLQRTSRVPSDRESTVFSSDNEHSRVFSADGDDTDYRSETVFDSIRTDATGHSHAGGRTHHIEQVFKDANTPELAKHNLIALQENLEQTSLSDVHRPHSRITEEEESVATPTQKANSTRASTASPRRSGVPAGIVTPSSPPRLSTPSRSREIYPQSLEFEDEWSADEGDDEGEGDLFPRGILDQSSGDKVELRPRQQHAQLSERPKSNIFDWSERQPEKEGLPGSSRPQTAHVKQGQDRGSRSTSRRGPSSYHIRSQSVPLPPENTNYRFNNASKLDAWMLGGKGVSEDWDGDFDFDEDLEDGPKEKGLQLNSERDGVIVPPSIIEKQASVHGQFGQVKELTLLVEELRRLRHTALRLSILHGQASELWKEAEGIIDLATLEDEGDLFPPNSPSSTNFDFDAFDEDYTSRRRRSSASPQVDATNDGQAATKPSPGGSKFSTPTGRPRNESIAKAKNVLENIHQNRGSLQQLSGSPVSPRKLPFDTTSLRDLVTRAGVVTRALKEVVRRVETPDSLPQTPERSSEPPPDPPFVSQIFHQSPSSSPSSSKRSPRVVRRKSSSNFLNNSKTSNDNDFNGHMKVMTVA